MVAVLAFACSNKSDKPQSSAEEPSQYELEARATREAFRVVLADFHADVVAGRLDAAYERLAPMYKASVPPEKFAPVAKHPFFSAGVTFTVRKTSETQGTARVSLLMQGSQGGGQIDMRCTQVSGVWKISGLSIDAMPVLPAP